MDWLEQNRRVAEVCASFPDEFGLRAFPGERFCVVKGDSFWSDGAVVVYTYIKRGGGWLAFAKGSPEELRDQLTP